MEQQSRAQDRLLGVRHPVSPEGHILIVDDDAEIRRLAGKFLREHGHKVTAAQDAREMREIMATGPVDLVILDVMLPGVSGLDLCRDIRRTSNVPIIMLTARGSDVDRIVGLELGADDYLAKPFNPRELLARIQALVRRQRILGAHTGPMAEDGELRFGEHVLHLGRRTLRRGDAEVPLTTGEFGLLAVFAQNAGRPLGRERLIELARGRDHEATDRSIDVQVMRLRKLIEADPAQPRHIRTVWGVGYVFVPEPE